jgi:uncharacterized membrane protein YdjX (TVP38/TMEM64 family)
LGGTFWGALAATFGSLTAFVIARSTLGERVARMLARNARLGRFEHGLRERGLWLTVLLRLSLFFPIGPVSYALGLSRIHARYFLVSLPALLPTVFTYSYAGHVAHSLFSASSRHREPWEWVIVALGLLASIAAAWLLGHAATRALSQEPFNRQRFNRITLPGSVDGSDLRPTKAHDAQGNPRTVGVEIEFAALDLVTAGHNISALFGGEIELEHDYALRVAGTSLGDFRVEIDSHALQSLADKRRKQAPIYLFERIKGAVLDAVADSLTPHELSTAPLRFDQLVEIDRLVHALGRAGAEGTDDSIFHVLGVHFNPSVASVEPADLRDVIRAYVLLHDELVEALHVNPVRRMMRFATAYPTAYARKVLDPAYAPTLEQLIDDYLDHNPTRNRGLDLLPLFAHLDPARVHARTKDPRIQARPTFHFRLPNSEISKLNWRITDEWRLWLEVESLANDPRRIAAVSREALAHFELPKMLRGKWNALRRMHDHRSDPR